MLLIMLGISDEKSSYMQGKLCKTILIRVITIFVKLYHIRSLFALQEE